MVFDVIVSVVSLNSELLRIQGLPRVVGVCKASAVESESEAAARYNLLAGGLLTGKHQSWESVPLAGRFANNPKYQQRYWKQLYFEAVAAAREAARASNITLAEAAVRWLRHHSAISTASAAGLPRRESRLCSCFNRRLAAYFPPDRFKMARWLCSLTD